MTSRPSVYVVFCYLIKDIMKEIGGEEEIIEDIAA